MHASIMYNRLFFKAVRNIKAVTIE